MTSTPE